MLIARFPIDVTEGGIFICFNEVHRLNVPSFISSMSNGMETSVNEEHPLNAFSPIEITEEGIFISFNDEQPLNDEFPM